MTTTPPEKSEQTTHDSRGAPLLTRVWLDADRYTYEALCTAGAAAITVLPFNADTSHNGMREANGERRSSNSSKQHHSINHSCESLNTSPNLNSRTLSSVAAVRLLPHENLSRKRSRGRAASDEYYKDAKREVALTCPTTTAAAVEPSDADARLDVLEEVELCSVIPTLPRTFGVDQLVQQVVPCTAYLMPAENKSKDDAAAHKAGDEEKRTAEKMDREGQFGCLEHLRRAADQHAAALRFPGTVTAYPRVVSPRHHSEEASVARCSATQEAQDSNFGTDDVVNSAAACLPPLLHRRPCGYVCADLPPVPPCMRASADTWRTDSPSGFDSCDTSVKEERQNAFTHAEEGKAKGEAAPSSASRTPSPHTSFVKESLSAISGDVSPASAPAAAPFPLQSNQKHGSVNESRTRKNADRQGKSTAEAESNRSGKIDTQRAFLAFPRRPPFSDSTSEENRWQQPDSATCEKKTLTQQTCWTFARALELYEQHRRRWIGEDTPEDRESCAAEREEDLSKSSSSSSSSSSNHGGNIDRAMQLRGIAQTVEPLPVASTIGFHDSATAGQAVKNAKSVISFSSGNTINNINDTTSTTSAQLQSSADKAGAAPAATTSTHSVRQGATVKEEKPDIHIATAAKVFWSSTATYFASSHASNDPFSATADADGSAHPLLTDLPGDDPNTDFLPSPPSPLSGSAAATAADKEGPAPPSADHSPYRHVPLPTHPAGAIVEWTSGVVSYTADTAGLMEEQQARAQRFFALPPPLPRRKNASAEPLSITSALTAGAKRKGGACTMVEKRCPPDSRDGGVMAEELTSLRGAVLAQLQRLQRSSAAATAHCHGEPACTFMTHPAAAAAARQTSATTTSASSPREVPTTPRAPRPAQFNVSSSEPSRSSSSPAAARTAKVAEAVVSPVRCTCHRCAPLQLQFAQVPLMTSATLKRYLDLLHQTALPGLTHPYPPSLRGTPAADNHTANTTTTPPPPHTNPDGGQEGEEREEEGGATCIRKGAVGSHRSSPASPSAREQRRVAVDPLDLVFPALQQWLEAVSQGEPRRDTRTAAATTNCEGVTVKAAVHNCNDTPSNGKRVSRSVDAGSAVTPDATMSACWIDDAVLDEAVLVGVVPRGQPHQLRLVAPSRAFALTLVQRLEEVCEASLHILTHISFPLNLSELQSTRRAEVYEGGGTTTTAAASTRVMTTRMQTQWQSWLENAYFTALWSAVRDQLSAAEWHTMLHVAARSPFLPSPSQLVSATRSDDALLASLSSFFHRSDDSTMSATPITGTLSSLAEDTYTAPEVNERDDDEETAQVRRRMCRVRQSLTHAAVAHATACVSAAEDVTARVMLTALTPLLHRRLTVMYELLRHLASKSLYASHRAQCEAYQQWYTTTPSPASVLRLLQRSVRFSAALARCYPQYDLRRVRHTHAQDCQHVNKETMLYASSSSAAPVFPSRPLTAPQQASVAGTTRHGRSQDLNPANTPSNVKEEAGDKETEKGRDETSGEGVTEVVKRGRGRPRKTTTTTTCANGEAARTAESYPPLVPLITTPTSPADTAVPDEDAAIPWSPVPSYPVTPSLEDATPPLLDTPASPRPLNAPTTTTAQATTTFTAAAGSVSAFSPLSPNSPHSGSATLTYVPESALLDPRYLQRFAWYTHRTHHNSSNGVTASHHHTHHHHNINNNNNGGSGGGGSTGFSAGSGDASALSASSQSGGPRRPAHGTVMSIPGDYTRVLPLHEQDAAIRTVLRSMAQKGRTLDMWEMSQHIQTHHSTPYVYR